ncbi:unnamed protein product [Amoebophrya sp. A120]|nr:unnamed protein product [Amoebophrya sp. A120]|eukprot:GSA120T00006298001.1
MDLDFCLPRQLSSLLLCSDTTLRSDSTAKNSAKTKTSYTTTTSPPAAAKDNSASSPTTDKDQIAAFSGKKMSPTRERTYAVLLVSHGSPSKEWNASQITLRDQVEKLLQQGHGETTTTDHATKHAATLQKKVKIVKWAWLEFAEPDIKQAMEELEQSGEVDHVIAIPVFISVSSHSERDIPNCLNTRFTPERDDDLRRYCGFLPVTYCSSLDHGTVLPEILLDSARKMLVSSSSTTHDYTPLSAAEQAQTAVVTVSHGDGCEHFWGHLHARIRDRIAAEFPALKVNTWCYLQTLRKPFVQKRFIDAIAGAIEAGEGKVTKVVVLSCFNGTGGRQFLERLDSMYYPYVDPLSAEEHKPLKQRFPEVEIVGDEPWMGDRRIAEWCVWMAGECVGSMEPAKDDAMEVEEASEDELDFSKKTQPPYNPPFWLTRDKEADLKAMMAPPLKSSKGKGKGASGGGKEKGAKSSTGTSSKGAENAEKGSACCVPSGVAAKGGKEDGKKSGKSSTAVSKTGAEEQDEQTGIKSGHKGGKDNAALADDASGVYGKSGGCGKSK